MREHVSSLHADANDARQQANHAVRFLFIGLIFVEAGHSLLFNFFDLILDEPQASHVAAQFRSCKGRNGAAFRREQAIKPISSFP